jgi:hypothetical protein
VRVKTINLNIYTVLNFRVSIGHKASKAMEQQGMKKIKET